MTASAADRIRVLVVDDSAVVRRMLAALIGGQPDLAVVAEAADPFEAQQAIARCEPDVITLDVAMPRMDGISFLEKLMKHRPLPVVVLSSLTREGGELAAQALALGAAEVLAKPTASTGSLRELSPALMRAIRAAACTAVAPRPAAPARPRAEASSGDFHPGSLIAIGASTGGPQALERILAELPAATPPVLVAQHLPVGFTAAFARRLDRACAVRVEEAEHGRALRPGTALVAPGDRHLTVQLRDGAASARVTRGPKVHFQRPSVDVLFRSVAEACGPLGVGLLLTGMGQDGALGLLEMRNAGARTLAQDEASSAVYGMPRRAVELGAAEDVVPLERAATALIDALRRIATREAGEKRRPGGEEEP